MGQTKAAREQRDRVIDRLVDEEYDRRIAAGTLDKGKLRDLIRQDVVAQAREHPTWLRQQSDRLFGAVRRPGGQHTCPHCEITFDPTPNPYDPPALRPQRGPDAQLYCSRGCADQEPLVSLDEFLAANPDAAAPGRFLRAYLEHTGGLDRLPQLDLLTIGDDT